MSFIRLITHVYGDVRHHPAVTAAKDRAEMLEMNAKLSEPMKPHETSKALEDRCRYCLNKYNEFSDTKRFSDTEGGKADQCELIMSLLEFNLKSTVMSEFDAVRHKAERKQKSPPEMAKLWRIIHKQFELIDIKNARKCSLLGTADTSNFEGSKTQVR
jgi:hypothetical protein